MGCSFLRGEGVLYELGECTTIGRRQCGLIIDSSSVDDRHATIHFSKTEDVFILQDLNSRNGTFVNGFRVHTVRLSSGDNIKFGLHQVIYQFGVGRVEESPSCPPIARSVEVIEEFDSTSSAVFTEPIGTRSTVRQPIHCTVRSDPIETFCDTTEGSEQQLKQELRNVKNLLTESTKKDRELRQQREIIIELENKLDSLRNAKNRISQEYSASLELRQKLQQDIAAKESLIMDLKDQIKVRDVKPTVVEIQTPNVEVVRSSRDKRILEDLVTQLQRDSISKDDIISRQSVEISSAKDMLRNVTVNKQRDSEVEALRKSIADRDEGQRKLSVELESTRQEMAKQRQRAASLSRQCDALEAQIRDSRVENADLERSGSITKAELHKTVANYQKFKSKIIDSIASVLTDCEEISDDVITREVARLCKVKEVYEERVGSLGKEIERLSSSETLFQERMGQLRKGICEDLREYIRSESPVSAHLDSLIAKLESKHSLDESVAWIRDSLLTVLKYQSNTMHEIEDSLEKCETVPFNPQKPIKESIETLRERLEETRARHEESLSKIEQLKEKFKGDIRQLNVEAEKELKQQIDRAVDQCLDDERDRHSAEITSIRREESDKMTRFSVEQSAKINELGMTIDRLTLTIQSREAELEAQRAKFGNYKDSAVVYKQNEEKLLGEIEGLKDSLEEANASKLKEMAELRDHYEREGRNYREQIKQHSVTICRQEEALTRMKQKKKLTKSELNFARMKTAELSQSAGSRPPPTPVPPLPARVVFEPPHADTVELRNTISRLKDEIKRLESVSAEGEAANTALRREITIMKAKMTDRAGDSQRRELIEARGLLRMRDDEIAALQRTNPEVPKEQLEKLKRKLSQKEQSLQRVEESLAERTREVERVKEQLTESRDQRNLAMAQLEKYPKSDELVAAGSQCRGERHLTIIEKQAEALTELRGRIKEFETSRLLPAPDSGLKQQNILLKRDLAEMKTREMFNKNSLIRNTAKPIQRKVSYSHPAPMPNFEEKFAASETLTLNFLSELSSLVGLTNGVSLHSLVHMPPIESESLLSERRQLFDMIVSKVSIIGEKLQKKSNLLLQYEKDLSRMKVLEDLSSKTKENIENYLETIRLKTEEVEYMKETLGKYREMLNAEKRLNSAIKSRKTFHMENERAEREYRTHRCVPDDVLAQSENRCRALFEEIRKKDFIISRQESDLAEKSRLLGRIRVAKGDDDYSVTSEDPQESPAAA